MTALISFSVMEPVVQSPIEIFFLEIGYRGFMPEVVSMSRTRCEEYAIDAGIEKGRMMMGMMNECRIPLCLVMR